MADVKSDTEDSYSDVEDSDVEDREGDVEDREGDMEDGQSDNDDSQSDMEGNQHNTDDSECDYELFPTRELQREQQPPFSGNATRPRASALRARRPPRLKPRRNDQPLPPRKKLHGYEPSRESSLFTQAARAAPPLGSGTSREHSLYLAGGYKNLPYYTDVSDWAA